MTKPCFFCDIQTQDDTMRFAENEYFFARYDDFAISKGHCEIIPKKHIVSFFDLNQEEREAFYALISEAKTIIDAAHNPDGYNIGINEGEAAGRTQHHLHIHLIPRYIGDVENPRGGVRHIIPKNADYIPDLKEMKGREQYAE
ncbi:HIT family protein [Patescibacteria group bacterium]|nr:HIT family protein [Patescibacteria group bacterium]MBU1722052.1 HIT family protein [Patescibacteria group bacterium]MBU1901522.1 HIT family protein [Patescibacteria group bacterium]